mmetsp:Transcript_18474/g.22628  ORF Transcript_18474/g.22628 Transcript_18474/m.22628 type:complete len:537 (-) Transcript_18474:15-1625(-)
MDPYDHNSSNSEEEERRRKHRETQQQERLRYLREQIAQQEQQGAQVLLEEERRQEQRRKKTKQSSDGANTSGGQQQQQHPQQQQQQHAQSSGDGMMTMMPQAPHSFGNGTHNKASASPQHSTTVSTCSVSTLATSVHYSNNQQQQRPQDSQSLQRLQRHLQYLTLSMGLSFLYLILLIVPQMAILTIALIGGLSATTFSVGQRYLETYYRTLIRPQGLQFFLSPNSYLFQIMNMSLEEWLSSNGEPGFMDNYGFLALYFIPGLSDAQRTALVNRLPESRRRMLRDEGFLYHLLPESWRRELMPADNGAAPVQVLVDDDHEEEEVTVPVPTREIVHPNTSPGLFARLNNLLPFGATTDSIPSDLVYNDQPIPRQTVVRGTVHQNDDMSQVTTPPTPPVSPTQQSSDVDEDAVVLSSALQTMVTNYRTQANTAVRSMVTSSLLPMARYGMGMLSLYGGSTFFLRSGMASSSRALLASANGSGSNNSRNPNLMLGAMASGMAAGLMGMVISGRVLNAWMGSADIPTDTKDPKNSDDDDL